MNKIIFKCLETFVFYIIRLYLIFCLLSLLWHWKAITVFLQTKRLNNYKKVKKSLAADVADLLSVSNLFTCFALERHLAWNIHLQGESEKHFEIKKKPKPTYFCFLLPEWRCCRSVVSFGVWVGESGWSLRGHCSTRERRQKERSCVQPKLQGGSGNHTQMQTSQTHLWCILVTVQPLERLERDVWKKVTHFQSSISTGNGQRTALPFSITAPVHASVISYFLQKYVGKFTLYMNDSLWFLTLFTGDKNSTGEHL